MSDSELIFLFEALLSRDFALDPGQEVKRQQSASTELQVDPVVVHEADHLVERGDVLQRELVEIRGNVACNQCEAQSESDQSKIEASEDDVASRRFLEHSVTTLT